MLVKMRKHITGFRDGAEWPPIGGTIRVGDAEGRRLVANRYAEEVTDADTAAEQDANTAAGSDVTAGPADGYDGLKVAELRGLATDRGVTTASPQPKKAELIAALRAADAAGQGTAGSDDEDTDDDDTDDDAAAEPDEDVDVDADDSADGTR